MTILELQILNVSSGHHIACIFPVQAEMASIKLLPLLDRLAGEPDELLRRSLLTAISVMAQPGSSGDAMPTAVREGWAEKVTPPPCPLFLSFTSQ